MYDNDDDSDDDEIYWFWLFTRDYIFHWISLFILYISVIDINSVIFNL